MAKFARELSKLTEQAFPQWPVDHQDKLVSQKILQEIDKQDWAEAFHTARPCILQGAVRMAVQAEARAASVITRATAKAEEHVPRPTVPLIILPCYKGLGVKIKRMGRTIGFQVYFKSAASVRPIVRNEKIRLAPNEKPGVIYEILYTCPASYIGETGNTSSHRYEEHLSCLNRYKNALNDQKGLGTKRRGRPRLLQPNEAMDEAIKASAIVSTRPWPIAPKHCHQRARHPLTEN
ncbi:hypothetical protein M513_07748 [Trichuris suis]|uniref:GIY-YIG domain-containing protein n=1 Tax=Trichuris suis TaxID=68888 RepID=A0A085M297_9BILA|nr:hypothetical protein M513_07748 [Trichuris suis]